MPDDDNIYIRIYVKNINRDRERDIVFQIKQKFRYK
jgi:hypothetical protein